MPLVGSGFDSLASQGQYWSGFNNSVDRANLDSMERANAERNRYFQNIAEMNRRDAENQQRQQAGAEDAAQQRYQFGANLAERQAESKAGLDIDRAKIEAQKYEYQRRQALNDAAGDLQAVSDLAAKGHFASKNEISAALPSATKSQIDDLWDANDTFRKEVDQQFSFASSLSDKENEKAALGKTIAKGDAPIPVPPTNQWWNPAQWVGAGALARGAGKLYSRLEGTQAPDTSWFDALQKKKSAVDAQLAPFDSQKGGAAASGLILDPLTGQYKPISTPAWARGATVSPTSPKTQRYQSPDDVKSAYKSGQLSREDAAAILQSQFGME